MLYYKAFITAESIFILLFKIANEMYLYLLYNVYFFNRKGKNEEV